jgi:hypothetical protein
LRGTPDLETLYMYETTRVADADLQPIMDLPNLKNFRMQNRREYKPSVSEIEQVLAERNRQ